MNQLKISSSFNVISFKQKEITNPDTYTNTQTPTNDTFEKEANPEPPEIKPSQFLYGGKVDLTDEQIIQINKAKMLPKNAQFVYQNGRGQLPHYNITKADPNDKLEPIKKQTFFPIFAPNRRDLPPGYEVRRGYTGNPIAVPLDQQANK